MKFPNTKGLLIGGIYRPPDLAQNVFIQSLEPILEKAFMEDKEIILVGDFNIDYTHGFDEHSEWRYFMESFSLQQMVNSPTRITDTTSTIIDHVYMSHPDRSAKLEVKCISASDHFPVCFTHKKYNIKKNKHTLIEYRSHKTFNENAFIQDLQSKPWNTVFQHDNPENALLVFEEMYKDVLDYHLPKRVRRVKHEVQPEWMTPDILEHMHKRDRYKAEGNKDMYRIYRNQCVQMVENAKESLYKRKLEEAATSKDAWKYLKEIIPSKSSVDPCMIKENDVDITDPKDIAEAFNKHFVEIAEKYIPPSNKTFNSEKLKQYVDDLVDATSRFSIPEMSQNFVERELARMQPNKSTGLDGIGARLLRIASHIVAAPLQHIYNLSIRTGVFPSRWKEARVTPIFKSGDIQDKGNYRPISILPILSKIIERHVHKHLYNFLMEYKLLHSGQSGFRHSHSCETALLKIIDTWIDAMNRGDLNGVIFIDLRKAFDLVNHDLLLQKLQLYHCNDRSLAWFKSYLSDRKQCVRFNGQLSDTQEVTVGVPQGSILGPLLFIIFINDLCLHCENNLDMYADDSTIHAQRRSTGELETTLNRDLENVGNWCDENKMAINSTKTHSMLVTTWQKLIHLDKKELDLEYKGTVLGKSTSEKVLGLIIDKHINWNEHVKLIHKKVSAKLAIFRKIKNHLPIKYRKLYYSAFVLPHLDYCSTVWSTTSEHNALLLLRLQKRAARLILDKPLRTSSQAMFKELRWMPLQDRIKYRDMVMVYKARHQQIPQYITSMFDTVQNHHSAYTRAAVHNHLYRNQFSLEMTRKSFKFRSIPMWNNLPRHIKEAQTLTEFKKLYTDDFFGSGLQE